MTAVPGDDGSDISEQAAPAPDPVPVLSAQTDATEGGVSPALSATPGAAAESGKPDGTDSAAGAGAGDGDDAAAGGKSKGSPSRHHQGEGEGEYKGAQQSGRPDGDDTGGDAPSGAAAGAAAAGGSGPAGGEGLPPSAAGPAAAAVGDGRVEYFAQAEGTAMTTVEKDGGKSDTGVASMEMQESGAGGLPGTRPPAMEDEEQAGKDVTGDCPPSPFRAGSCGGVRVRCYCCG